VGYGLKANAIKPAISNRTTAAAKPKPSGKEKENGFAGGLAGAVGGGAGSADGAGGTGSGGLATGGA
jgi:hypothetical protein